MPSRNNSPRLASGRRFVAAVLAALALCLLLFPAAARSQEDLDALLKRLPGESPFGRYKVIESIGDLGTQEAVRALVDLFPDEELRWMAVRQVSQLKAVAVPVLLEALRAPDADTVRFAAYCLGEIRAAQAVPGLVPLLASPNAEIRQHVAYALGMIRDKAATDALIGALKDADPVVRGYAATALGEIGDPRAKEALVAALRTEDASVVNMATSLYNLGSEEVVEILIGKLRDPNPNNRLYAIYALGKISDPKMVRPLIDVLDSGEVGWLAAKALVNIGQPALQPLLEALFSENRTVRLYATYALGEIREPKAARGVLRMLEDKDPLVVDTAAEALVAIGERSVIPAVTQLLVNAEPRVRQRALDVLGGLGDASLAETITSMISDPDREVVKSAITALGKTRSVGSCVLAGRLLALPGEDLQDSLRVAFLAMGEPAVACLSSVLESASGEPLVRAIYLLGKLKASDAVGSIIQRLHDPNPAVRRFAAVALTEIGDPRAEEYFVGLLGDRDPALRTYATVGLMSIGGKISIRLLLASLNDPETRWLAVRILDKIGSRDIDSLIGALKDERTGWYAQQALTKLDAAVLPQLEERLKGPDPKIREGVARVMGEVRDRRAVGPLLEAIQTAGDTGRSSATALIQIADPASVDPLIELLTNQGEQVRLYAAYALGGLKDRRAVPALSRSLSDTSSSVRGIAAHALGQIGARDATAVLVSALDDTSAHVRATAAYALARIGDRAAIPRLEVLQEKDTDFTVRKAAGETLEALQRSGR
jgi:HEAT repeat protein